MEPSEEKDIIEVVNFNEILNEIFEEKSEIEHLLSKFVYKSARYILSNYQSGKDPQNRGLTRISSLGNDNVINCERRITNELKFVGLLREAIKKVCQLHEYVAKKVCFGRYTKEIKSLGGGGIINAIMNVKDKNCLETPNKENFVKIVKILGRIIKSMDNIRKIRNEIEHGKNNVHFLINSSNMDIIKCLLIKKGSEEKTIGILHIPEIRKNLSRLLDEIICLNKLDMLLGKIAYMQLIGLFVRKDKIYLVRIYLQYTILDAESFSNGPNMIATISSMERMCVYTHVNDNGTECISQTNFPEEEEMPEKVYLLLRNTYPGNGNDLVRFASTANSIYIGKSFRIGSQIGGSEVEEYLNHFSDTLSSTITCSRGEFNEIIRRCP